MKIKSSPVISVKKRTVAYVRVSTSEQVEGVSIQAQEARIRSFALATSREIDEVYVDEGQSAKSLARPALQNLLVGVRDGTIGTVIILKLDRISRSIRGFCELIDIFKKSGAGLVSVSESIDTSSASSRMVTNLMA